MALNRTTWNDYDTGTVVISSLLVWAGLWFLSKHGFYLTPSDIVGWILVITGLLFQGVVVLQVLIRKRLSLRLCIGIAVMLPGVVAVDHLVNPPTPQSSWPGG